MYVINFDLCAIVLLVVILISNIYRKMTRGKTNKYFLGVICLALFSAISDFLSGYGANTFVPSTQNKILMYIFNYVYFFSHSNIIFMYFMYCVSSMNIWHILKKNKPFFYFLVVLHVTTNLNIILNLIFGKMFIINDLMQYVRGPLIVVIYANTIITTLLFTIAILKYRKYAKRTKWLSLLSMVPVYCLAMLIQAIDSHMLIEMFFLAILIILFVFVVQSQEEYRDPVSGAKKYNSGVDSIKLIMSLQKPVKVVTVKFANNKNIRMYLGQNRYNFLLHDTSDSFNTFVQEEGIDADIYYLEYGLFAILSDSASENQLIEIAKKVKDKYSKTYMFDDMELLVDARICFLDMPKDISDFSSLLTFGVTYHNTMPETNEILYYRDFVNDKEFIVKNKLEEIINRGLSENKFKIQYKPIFSYSEKRFVAAEATLRLYDDNYGEISPALFIPMAELSGSIHSIGNYVFESVFKFISENDLKSLGIDYIHVNMSASQCIEMDLVDKVKYYLEKYNVPSNIICIGINESAADYDPDIVDHNISELKKLGIRFLLDDYGSGYANVMRAVALPIEIVKFDKEFISRINEEKYKILIEGTIKMLKSMDKKVLVQNIDDIEIVKYYEELGCDYILGCRYDDKLTKCDMLQGREFIQFLKDNK